VNCGVISLSLRMSAAWVVAWAVRACLLIFKVWCDHVKVSALPQDIKSLSLFVCSYNCNVLLDDTAVEL
jgi:hypothetical protein